MIINCRYFFTSFLLISIFYVGANYACAIDGKAERNKKTKKESLDALAILYRIADEKGLRVITDLNMHGGELYKKDKPENVAEQYKVYIKQMHQRYGHHKSFWGWYINNELNPLKVEEGPISTFWRTVWRSAVEECKRVAPSTVVTISPFFLLDIHAHRGYAYLQPIEYQKWWAKTLSETGIDILMLQDSGAEHLGFFTLRDRKPFFQAFKNACDQAGSKLWLNVETGEVDAKNWKEAISMERGNKQKWVYTDTKWLAQKLKLAAEFGDEIISWGYYPFMNPNAADGPYLKDEITAEVAKQNYDSYKSYYKQQVKKSKNKGALTKPLINGSLWWMPITYEGWSKEKLENVIRTQIQKQVDVGFDVLWILNAPSHLEFAINNQK